ncbi:TetR/AcrR family transcriptional regulator [Amycolatopsis antarctica]|nr:TetR/AcrR family transcriptional regulator [Amycolatopsis antarctica]
MSAGRRGELVRVAFDLVASGGLEGLRLRQVAEGVGIDHSTLHHHFPTKQHLVEAVAEYATAQFHVTAPPAGPDPRFRLASHLDALLTLLRHRPELFVVTAELDLRARRDPAVRAALDRHESGWRTALAGVFVTAGRDDEAVAEATAETVIAAVKGVRLTPELAPAVFARLAAVWTDGTEATEEE